MIVSFISSRDTTNFITYGATVDDGMPVLQSVTDTNQLQDLLIVRVVLWKEPKDNIASSQ